MVYRKMRGRAASVSAKTRPKVHLAAHSAPRRRRNPPPAALGAEVQNRSLRPWCSGSSLRASHTKELDARRPEARKADPRCTYSGHGLRLASSTSTRRQEAAAYRDVRRASTRVAWASEQCKNGGRAATLSPKSRPKVHLPVLRARARPDSHGDLRTKASGASGRTGLTGALRSVEQDAAIGSQWVPPFSHTGSNRANRAREKVRAVPMPSASGMSGRAASVAAWLRAVCEHAAAAAPHFGAENGERRRRLAG